MVPEPMQASSHVRITDATQPITPRTSPRCRNRPRSCDAKTSVLAFEVPGCMMGDGKDNTNRFARSGQAAVAAAGLRATAIASVGANLRQAYRGALSEPLPPAIDDLLRGLE